MRTSKSRDATVGDGQYGYEDHPTEATCASHEPGCQAIAPPWKPVVARRCSRRPEPLHMVTFNSAGTYVSGFGSSLSQRNGESGLVVSPAAAIASVMAAAVSGSRYGQTTECMTTKAVPLVAWTTHGAPRWPHPPRRWWPASAGPSQWRDLSGGIVHEAPARHRRATSRHPSGWSHRSDAGHTRAGRRSPLPARNWELLPPRGW